MPSGREVAPALEFPDLRDYRGIVDCKMRQSGLDQSKLGDLAVAAQIDFIFLGDYAEKNSADFGVGGFTDNVLFFPGAAYKIGNDGAEIVALNFQRPIDESKDIIGQIHDQHALALAAISPHLVRRTNMRWPMRLRSTTSSARGIRIARWRFI